jgi:hypothetical protein
MAAPAAFMNAAVDLMAAINIAAINSFAADFPAAVTPTSAAASHVAAGK